MWIVIARWIVWRTMDVSREACLHLIRKHKFGLLLYAGKLGGL